MQAEATTSRTTRRLPCPAWCCGGDHEPLIPGDVFGEEPQHYGLIADALNWSVEINRSVYGGGHYVTVNHGDEHIVMQGAGARSLGAALLRAADLIETDGCDGR